MERSFDYIEFANDIKTQARRLVPYELRSERDFIVNKMEEQVIKLAKGFESENFKSDLDDEKYVFGTTVQLNTRSISDFSIYLTEIKFKKNILSYLLLLSQETFLSIK